MDLPLKQVDKPALVALNITEQDDMLFHHLALREMERSAVTLAVYPLQNESLHVFIQFNELPTVDKFYRKIQVMLKLAFL